MSVTTGRSATRLPAEAQRLRRPLHRRSEARTRERWGFGLNDRDATDRAEQLLRDAPDDADRLTLAASVRSSRGDAAGAMDAARRAVAAAPASARAHTTLSALLAGSGDLDAAREEAETAVSLDADDPAARYNRGVLAWLAGDRGVARDDLAAVRDALEASGDERRGFVRSWMRAWRARRAGR